jgi:uncharacterized protein YbdZ (MbtH family)
MSGSDAASDNTTYKVVVNIEEQYSIWSQYKVNPPGWRDAGKLGSQAECLAYINEVWTDMRPLSLRKKMEELGSTPPAPPANANALREGSLVERLCEGDHPVEVGLRHERTVTLFKEAIDRNYVHIKFTQTKGGTELAFCLDNGSSDFSNADFENGKGTAHVEGSLTVDYVKVRCIADVDLTTLAGKGRLAKI